MRKRSAMIFSSISARLQSCAAEAPPFAAPGNYSPGKIVALLIVLATATGSYSIHLGVDQMWDLKNYHLYNPLAALDDRYLYDIAPAGLQSYYNPILDFPFF
jgi:hypothetical protein